MEVVFLNSEELQKYSVLRGLNLGQAEKDYYQSILLFLLYGKTSKELVFKGGTALSKCYGLNRFSEDLDFTVRSEKDIVGIITKGLDDFGIRNRIREIKEISKAKKYKIKIEGPLYNQTERSLCSVTLDFSSRENVLLDPNVVTIGYHMDIIPTFEVYVMREEEIFAEKIRAIRTRTSARDLYDLVFLLRRGTKPNVDIINEKLQFYDLKFEAGKMVSACRRIEPIWKSELMSLVKNVPEFESYLKEVKNWTDNFQ